MWVLIIVGMTINLINSRGNIVTTQEFATIEKCEYAAQLIKPHVTAVYCVPK